MGRFKAFKPFVLRAPDSHPPRGGGIGTLRNGFIIWYGLRGNFVRDAPFSG